MILQINFKLNVPAAEYQKVVDSVAPALVNVPGLRWKIWLLNPAAREAGGIYLFDSPASMEAYLSGPLVAKLRALPAVEEISVKQFDVLPEATASTRGPVDVPGPA